MADKALAAGNSTADTRYVVYVNLSALLLIGVFAEPLLRHWMGTEFSIGGALILQLMALGQFIDSLTNLPSLVNDGRGHPKVSGLFAFSRAVLGLGLVYALVLRFQIVGAAWAHLLSGLVIGLAFIVYVHGRTVPVPLTTLLRRGWGVPMLGATAIAALTALLNQFTGDSVRHQAALALLAVGLLVAYGWRFVLLGTDRLALGRMLRARFARAA